MNTKSIVLCKESNNNKSIVYPLLLNKLTSYEINNLKLRSRYNFDLEYYILSIDESFDIPIEAYIETINKDLNILDKSNNIKKL